MTTQPITTPSNKIDNVDSVTQFIYARVSTQKQNLEPQIDELRKPILMRNWLGKRLPVKICTGLSLSC